MQEKHEKTGVPSADDADETTAPSAVEKEKMVRELYDLAEEVIEAYAAHDTARRFRTRWAGKRLARLTQAHLEGDFHAIRSGSHDWMLDSMEDLAAYCEREGLGLLRDFFLDARLVVSTLLKAEP